MKMLPNYRNVKLYLIYEDRRMSQTNVRKLLINIYKLQADQLLLNAILIHCGRLLFHSKNFPLRLITFFVSYISNL